MAGARWSQEQYAEHLAKRPGAVAVAGAGHRAVTVPKGLKLSKQSLDGVAEYLVQLKCAGIPLPEFEFYFHPDRKWRSDFAWADQMLLAEYEGGVYTNGAHVRGAHFESDAEKYNEAALLGYRVLRFTYGMVRSGMALEMTERALAQ